MALRDWTRKTETEGVPFAKIANLLSCPEEKAQDSRIAKIAEGQAQKQEPEPVDFDGEILAVIHEFDRHGVTILGVSQEIRQETLALEDEITVACNAGDVPRFREALHAWRTAFLRSLH